MECPRLTHFSRLMGDGTVGRCGHMVDAKGFKDHETLEKSEWIDNLKKQMSEEQWPKECIRCQRTEEAGGKSIRMASIDRHKILSPLRNDYLLVGGILDNICNSACQTCSADLSTKIGSLISKNYPRANNYETFRQLPQDRIVEIDVSGGEPTASKNYKKLLSNLPSSVKILRMNTNGSRMINELKTVLQNGVKVIVTLSLDGIGQTHDYVRWPILWKDYEKTLHKYIDMQKEYKNFNIDTWTTVSSLNIQDLPKIIKYTKRKGIQHNWGFLEQPSVLNVRYTNVFTSPARQFYPKQVGVDVDNTKALIKFMERQDKLRKIDFKDYFNLPANFPKNN